MLLMVNSTHDPPNNHLGVTGNMLSSVARVSTTLKAAILAGVTFPLARSPAGVSLGGLVGLVLIVLTALVPIHGKDFF